ncbi:hypothetical protein A6R68_09327 [Neotoma lepida]|uniref:Small ribosomal subunit protein eS6 n=1 Tax=Neotoma lepida TaxID=56216 RepID=A0A1A6G164_NEOLE|nr:hypothetical protein A6R68_09327 [Neotoma lepida]
MKANISSPATGYQKFIEVDDECKHRTFYKGMAMEAAADALGESGRVMWSESVVEITNKSLIQESKKPKTKAPMSQHLVTPHVLQHKRLRIALKKQCTKKNKKVAEYAKLLAKRMKEAKENHQEQTSKRCRLSSLRASASKSEFSQN